MPNEFCWCDIHLKAYICERWDLKLVDAPKGRFLEFFISWPPTWGSHLARISGIQADIANNQLKKGVLYIFRGKLDFAKTNGVWVINIISWDKVVGAKQKYTGKVYKKNKNKLVITEPDDYERAPNKETYLS